MTKPTPLPPGSTIGIIGAGQLGRMLAEAAVKLGFKTHLYAPETAPCGRFVTDTLTTAAYDDTKSLKHFASSVDVATFEFENIPLDAAALVAETVDLFPDPEALRVSQDRLIEKRFLNDLDIATAPFAPVDSIDDVASAAEIIGLPAILKTRRFGYDGKGQSRITRPADFAAAWDTIGQQPAVLEQFIEFEREISFIAARDRAGNVVNFAPGENIHKNHILHTTTVPARIKPETRAQAETIAKKIASALDYVGVFAVEFFVTASDDTEHLIVNEIAPRVHNSGHWTQDGCAASQFEQHIRAVCGWPLAATHRHSNAVMTNIIGPDANDWQTLVADPENSVHIYDKGDARPGRKMGHVTRLSPRTER